MTKRKTKRAKAVRGWAGKVEMNRKWMLDLNVCDSMGDSHFGVFRGQAVAREFFELAVPVEIREIVTKKRGKK